MILARSLRLTQGASERQIKSQKAKTKISSANLSGLFQSLNIDRNFQLVPNESPQVMDAKIKAIKPLCCQRNDC